MGRDRTCGRKALTLLALGIVSMTSGCAIDPTGSSRNSEIGWLDASATMRVEVEVYKGPLSKEPAVQVAELKGIVDDSERAMEILLDNMDYSRRQMKCYQPGACEQQAAKRSVNCNPPECDKQAKYNTALDMCKKLRRIEEEITITAGRFEKRSIPFDFTFKQGDPYSRNETQACNSLMQLFRDIAEGIKKYQSVKGALPSLVSGKTEHSEFVKKCGFAVPRHKDNTDLNTCENRLSQVSTYGSYLKRRAAYWAAEHVATSPLSTRLRIEMANFAQFAAEYGNQITSRADALLKQAAGARGVAILREQLPNSTYLRDSEPTAYLNLYDWNEAAVEIGRATTPAQRIRIVEHLVADNYWSHINTVFAAGQGDVSMALVKDDVGNWNLKSFDNSPAELLGAYKELGLAAVKTTVELASERGGLSVAKNALNFADQIALGSTSGGRASETQKRLALMRQETARLVIDVGRDQKRRDEELASEISRLTGELGQDVSPESGLRGALKAADANLDAQVGAIETLEAGIAERVETIKGLEENVASLTKERDVAVSERDALIPVESTEPPAADGGAAPGGSTASQVAALNDRIGGLNDQITDKSTELSAKLEQQSMELKHLEAAWARLPELRRAADAAGMKLEAAEAALKAAQIRKSDLKNATVTRIQQLLDLHSAIVAQMAVAVAEAAGPTAPTEGVVPPPSQ